MNKNAIRAFLIHIKPFVKISYFAKKVGIPKSSISRFMANEVFDYMISLDKLQELYQTITDEMDNCA